MKRRGFITRILAGALGVGATGLGLATEAPGSTPTPAPAPPTDPDSLMARLHATIVRHRASGEEVNYFHTNEATLGELLEEVDLGLRYPTHRPGYQDIKFWGVTWWGVEHMAHHEILVSDVGIIEDPAPCPRCGGQGEIPVRGSLGDMSRYMGYRSDGNIPSSEGLVYESRPCPRCSVPVTHYPRKYL